MELLLLLAGLVFVIFLFSKIFGGKKKDPDKYYVVQERRTQVRNHVVKVPGGKKKRR